MSAAFMPSLAWALLDFLWQGALVGWGAALLLAAMRRASAQARYAVACGALLLCAALPLAGLAERLLGAAQSGQVIGTQLPALAQAAPAAPASLLPESVTSAAPSMLAQVQADVARRLPLVLMLWSIGAGALALRLLLGLAWVSRQSAPGAALPDGRWQARCTALAARLGVRRAVRLGLVDSVPGPMTAHWWRPVILLPAALASGMPVALVEALLAHELAHIRRHDYLVNLVQSVIEIGLFYHPAVWWLSRRIRSEREQVADALAATVVAPRQLAEALAALDRFQLSHPSHHLHQSHHSHHQLAHAAHGGHLMLRIKRLLRQDQEPLTWKSLVPVLGLAAACATFYANAQAPAPPAPPAPPVSHAMPAMPAMPAVPAMPAAPAMPAHAITPPTPPTPPAPPRPPRAERIGKQGNGSKGEPYALVRPGRDGIHGSSSSADWQQLQAAKASIPGEFLWFRKDGKAYVVRDPAVVGQVAQAWAPVDKLSDEMKVYSDQMDVHGKKMEALGRQMEQHARVANEPQQRDMDKLARQQNELGREMNRLGRQMDTADASRRAQLEKQMDALGARMGELGARMGEQGARMAAAKQPMEATGRQMEEAGKPMEALGEKMGVLGDRIGAQAVVSERATRDIIRDAMAKGLAQTAP